MPMKIISISGEKAIASLDGIEQEISISLLDGLKCGDYVLVHTGFAISRMNNEEAGNTLSALEEVRGVNDILR